MKLCAKWLLATIAAASMSVAYADANVTGAWKGKFQIDQAKLPKVTDPNQKKMMDGVMAQVKAMTLHLNLKGNKTFTMKVVGVPASPGAAKRDVNAEGTWTQKGSALTLKITKADGKAPKGNNPPQEVKILGGGKKLEMTLPGAGGMGGGKVVFTR